MAQLIANGQIATQYVDPEGQPSMRYPVEPQRLRLCDRGHHQPGRPGLGQDGPLRAAEAENLYGNVPGEKDEQLFASGVRYFK